MTTSILGMSNLKDIPNIEVVKSVKFLRLCFFFGVIGQLKFNTVSFCDRPIGHLINYIAKPISITCSSLLRLDLYCAFCYVW